MWGEPMKLGLCLSGGSVKGAVHIGVIKALEECGIKVDLIAGTSAGSIVAGLYASGMSIRRIERLSLNLPKGMFDLDYPGIIKAVFSLPQLLQGHRSFTGFVKGDVLEEFFSECTQGKFINETQIPLAISAVDINKGETIMFVSRKPLNFDYCYIDDIAISEAMRASISLPIVFKPKYVPSIGRFLVDGGLTDNIPLNVLQAMGADKIIAINLGYSGQMRREIDNVFEIAGQTVDIMSYRIVQLTNRLYNVTEIEGDRLRYRRGSDVIMLNPGVYNVSFFDVGRIRELINKGYHMIKQNINTIRKILNI